MQKINEKVRKDFNYSLWSFRRRFIVNFFDIRGKNCVVYFLFKYIDSGIKLDNKKYNQKLPHIYVMTNWMASNYFLSIVLWQKVVTCHPLCHNINMWKLLVILFVIFYFILLKVLTYAYRACLSILIELNMEIANIFNGINRITQATRWIRLQSQQ